MDGFGDLSIFFSYTTDFDFYVFSDGDGELRRESQPVRNRMTSPGFHFDWKRDAPAGGSSFWWSNTTVSLVHHSNGQDLEFETFFDETSTADEIRNVIAELENNQPSWMDGVSRGWNYLEIKGKFRMGDANENCDENFSCITLYADVKFPINQINDDIWWEPGNTSKFRDYNIVEATLSNEWGRNINSGEGKLSTGKKEFSLQLQCGNKGCSSNSWIRFDTYFGKGSFRLPLMIYAHLGRNEHFYNYHERTNTVGLGVQFNP